MENNIITREELENVQEFVKDYMFEEFGENLTSSKLKKLSTMFILWLKSDVNHGETSISNLYGI